MDINNLLQGVNCTCGRNHSCAVKYVYIEENATERLKQICDSYSHILIVADDNTFMAAGAKTLNNLQNKNIRQIIFTGSEILIPDEKAIDTVTDNLDGIELIIGIGSGVIQDLCKYVSHLNNIPYIIVATAPSMDGYASTGAAMITSGMKVTYSVGLPLAIIGDVDVLAGAPIDMIKAGYGDIIGKFSALNDWELSRLINNEYFCEYIYNITYEQILKNLKSAGGLLKRDKDSIKALMEALVIIGIMMSFAGSSRPASGSEHHLSHFFEITGIINNTKYFPHGIDVAYSTVITAQIRKKLMEKQDFGKSYRLTRQQYEEKIHSIYKNVAPECILLQDKVGNYAKDRSSVYTRKKDEIINIFKKMPSPEEIKDMLALVELDINGFYTLYDNDVIQNAILYGKDLKDRYTVLWLNYDLCGGEENVQ